jgi:thiamine-phosphate pyrophosphorylase
VKGFYFITDSRISRRGNISDVKNAIAAGVKVVQYREKFLDERSMYAEAFSLRTICKNIVFIINNRVDLALAVNADGVHLGQDDLPYTAARKLLGRKKIIGLTVHSIKEARQAQEAGADYIGVSPIFATGTKADAGKPLGTKLLNEIRQTVKIPIVAIGGITLSNAKEVISSGADCLCAISAVVTKANVKKEIIKFQETFS